MSPGSRRRSSSGGGMGGVSPTRPHYCGSPGCTRRGQAESVPRGVSTSRPHYCGSPGCTRRGATERVWVEETKVTPAKATLKTPVPARTFIVEPDAFDFTILRSHSSKGLTLAEVQYPGCSNYEGRKVLLLKRDIVDIAEMKTLDPHFLENHENQLLARFAPTAEGWKLGFDTFIALLKTMP